MVTIEIDKKSGFCFGVVNAINKAEEVIAEEGKLYCLGDLVHNELEMSRLENIGLKTISREEYNSLKNVTVLLRAHGEPPETYAIAQKNNIRLIDATCPVVLKLQKKVKEANEILKGDNGKVVIYGKPGHAEVVGLVGQTEGEALVVTSVKDLRSLEGIEKVNLFSQTTMELEGYAEIKEELRKKITIPENLKIEKSICKQVANRIPRIRAFAKDKDVIIFVGGAKSSNGKMLFAAAKQENEKSYLVSKPEDLNTEWFNNIFSVGICGATSTPGWLLEEVALYIGKKILGDNYKFLD